MITKTKIEVQAELIDEFIRNIFDNFPNAFLEIMDVNDIFLIIQFKNWGQNPIYLDYVKVKNGKHLFKVYNLTYEEEMSIRLKYES